MTENPNADLIATFYEAFGRRDGDAMAACYHRDVTFRDPAFGELHGDEARDMWRMLCRIGKDLKVEVSKIHAVNNGGSAHWEADYTFATKRKVHNVIDAKFKFRDGLIFDHVDDFDYATWAGQAFWIPGAILGRTPILPFVTNKLARKQLADFSAKRAKKLGLS